MKHPLEGVRAVTFDCFGTLIDWNAGIRAALRSMLGEAASGASDDDLLRLFGQLEHLAEQPPFKPYKDALREVARGMCERFGVEPDDSRTAALAESIKDWPVFDDTAKSLRRLKALGLSVGVLSNIDRDLFREPSKKLGVPLDLVVTAEDVRSYKPGHAHFDRAIEELEDSGVSKRQILHAAQSVHHDIVPARKLGLRCAHVARYGGVAGASYAGTDAKADHTVGSLSELADLLEDARK